MECRKVSRDFVTMSQWVMDVMSQVTICHMTRVTCGPWESKCIATVVKCISSRELSENSIEFSLSNSEQRDSWLNSSHWTLDADKGGVLLRENKTKVVTTIGNYLNNLEGFRKTDSELTNPCVRASHVQYASWCHYCNSLARCILGSYHIYKVQC